MLNSNEITSSSMDVSGFFTFNNRNAISVFGSIALLGKAFYILITFPGAAAPETGSAVSTTEQVVWALAVLTAEHVTELSEPKSLL